MWYVASQSALADKWIFFNPLIIIIMIIIIKMYISRVVRLDNSKLTIAINMFTIGLAWNHSNL